jgi:hypothetical protein
MLYGALFSVCSVKLMIVLSLLVLLFYGYFILLYVYFLLFYVILYYSIYYFLLFYVTSATGCLPNCSLQLYQKSLFILKQIQNTNTV